MLRGKRILAVVPARGGSKGIKLKNLREVGGVPLVARVGSVIRELPAIDRAVVSTDHEDIARVAEAAGIAAPFRRAPELSGDRIGDLDVLLHALQEMESLDGVLYDVVVMLQPTSPLRRAADVTATLEKLVTGGLDAVWTVSPTDSKAHPLKQLTVDKDDQALGYYDAAGAGIIARQQLSQLYHRNGVAYAFTRECLIEQGSIMGARTAAHVVDGPQISIDTESDLAFAEYLLSKADAHV